MFPLFYPTSVDAPVVQRSYVSGSPLVAAATKFHFAFRRIKIQTIARLTLFAYRCYLLTEARTEAKPSPLLPFACTFPFPARFILLVLSPLFSFFISPFHLLFFFYTSLIDECPVRIIVRDRTDWQICIKHARLFYALK